jgi:hypothetical protein
MAEKKQGKDELNDYDRQDLTNAYENRPISNRVLLSGAKSTC